MPAPAAPPAARGPPDVRGPAPEPVHVDRDAVVVLESADAGAEDGVGAQIHVDEPWDGYDHMKAKDVTAQLATADPATLAVVRLYETTHRNRRTVLAEIDRRLRSKRRLGQPVSAAPGGSRRGPRASSRSRGTPAGRAARRRRAR